MASERQIAANRRNAAKSTGPQTDEGKLRSRQNAMQHGLTAETVIAVLEDREEYESFERALCVDFDSHSVIEHHLVARLASVLWRLRRVTVIETGLFEIQGKLLLKDRRDRQTRSRFDRQLRPIYRYLREPHAPVSTPSEDRNSDGAAQRSWIPKQQSDLAAVYLRLCHRNGVAVDRLNRYEIALWRQLAQILCLIYATRHKSHPMPYLPRLVPSRSGETANMRPASKLR